MPNTPNDDPFPPGRGPDILIDRRRRTPITEIIKKESFHSKGWHAVVSMITVVAGCACFVLSCVAAMLIMKKTDK